MGSVFIKRLSGLGPWHIVPLAAFFSAVLAAAINNFMAALRLGGHSFGLFRTGSADIFAVSLAVSCLAIYLARSSARLMLEGEALRIKDSAIASSINGIAISDLKGKISFVNRSFLMLWGYEDENGVLGRPVLEFWEEPGKAGEVLEALRARGSWIGELSGRRKDGALFDVQVSATLLGDSGVYMLSFLDVTERKRAEEALAEEKEFTENALDTLTDLFFVIDREGRSLRWNRAVNALTGYTDQEIASMSHIDFIPEEERWRTLQAVGRVLKEGYACEELTVLTRDGRRIPYEFTGSLLRDREGNTVGICGIGRDITERKLAEEALELTNTQLKNIFDNLDEVFFSSDAASGRKLQISPACEKVYGLPQRAFSENPMLWKEVIHPEDIASVNEAEKELRRGNPVKQAYRIIRPDGEIRWVEAKVKPTTGPSGAVIRIDGILSDITEGKRAEMERARLERHLLESRKLEAIGHLAGGIAHDFSNIMAIIQGNMELALVKSPEYLRGYIRKTLRAAERGAELVTNLLHFSDKSPVSFRAVDIASIARDTVRLLADSGGPVVENRVDAAPGLWKVKGDPAQLKQVVMNLYLNARDAIAECTGGNGRSFSIDMRLRNVTVDGDFLLENPMAVKGDFVHLSFRDNGRGMDEETLKHIFEPFFTTKKAGGGTGLGLSTVYGIVSRHGGWIDARSEAGKGTALDVYLPRFDGEPEENREEKKQCGLLGGNETILLVDDEEDILEAVREKLGDLGYRVLVAASGEAALAIFRKNRRKIDLVLLDQVMPGLRGTEVLEEIRRLNPETRVLMYSGKDLCAHARLPEGVSVITKPHNLDALAGKVGDILGAEWRYPVKSHINRVKLYYVEEPTVAHSGELTDAETVYRLFRHIATEPRETFIAVYLDSQNRVIAYDGLSTGTTNRTVVYPKEVVRAALMTNASSVILIHNHPAGGLRPSQVDVLLTAAIHQACESFEIRLEDHLIVSGKGYFSFRKEKIL
jgi:PAS domain S-box-containing protein